MAYVTESNSEKLGRIYVDGVKEIEALYYDGTDFTPLDGKSW